MSTCHKSSDNSSHVPQSSISTPAKEVDQIDVQLIRSNESSPLVIEGKESQGSYRIEGMSTHNGEETHYTISDSNVIVPPSWNRRRSGREQHGQYPQEHHRKRRFKRRRFTSPFLSDEDEDDYLPWSSKIHAKPRRSNQTSISSTQQGYKGEIISERKVKQRRGRPRQQYLVRWKEQWVWGSSIASTELLRY